MSTTADRRYRNEPRKELKEAARLVEVTAYELATDQPSAVVSELIVIAAEIDRLAMLIGSEE